MLTSCSDDNKNIPGGYEQIPPNPAGGFQRGVPPPHSRGGGGSREIREGGHYLLAEAAALPRPGGMPAARNIAVPVGRVKTWARDCILETLRIKKDLKTVENLHAASHFEPNPTVHNTGKLHAHSNPDAR